MESVKLPVVRFSPASLYFLVGPNIFLSTLFSNILSLCCSLTVKGHVSRPYKTTGHIGRKTNKIRKELKEETAD
jgi:hypothetical protein